MGNPVGRPPKYKTIDQLNKKIDAYFELADNENPTITGLAHHLGFASRQSIHDFEVKKKPEFAYTIKRAVLRIEEKHESGLYENANAGHIFWLKNRGWKDTQYIEDNMVKRIEIVKASERNSDN